MGRPVKLNTAQVEVLRWIADGCPDRQWPNSSYKLTAVALANRGLASVRRHRKTWTAMITEAGEYYLAHGRQPPRAKSAQTAVAENKSSVRRGGICEAESPDTTARAMYRIANRPKTKDVVRTRREIRETYMRYKVVVTRVQVAERFVRATSEEDAAAKVQTEFDRPYGYFGSWKTTSSEVDVVEAEQTTVVGPVNLSATGPALLSIKDAAKSLGISYSTLYQMMNQGDVEWVAIGSRKFVEREALMDFIRNNTHKGYYAAR